MMSKSADFWGTIQPPLHATEQPIHQDANLLVPWHCPEVGVTVLPTRTPSVRLGNVSSTKGTLGVPQHRTPSAPRGGLRQRLDRVNAYFNRKAAEVCADEAALRLLAVLYQDGIIELAGFDAGKFGVPLARLTAANFCEVGVNVICISEPGQQFIEAIQKL